MEGMEMLTCEHNCMSSERERETKQDQAVNRVWFLPVLFVDVQSLLSLAGVCWQPSISRGQKCEKYSAMKN